MLEIRKIAENFINNQRDYDILYLNDFLDGENMTEDEYAESITADLGHGKTEKYIEYLNDIIWEYENDMGCDTKMEKKTLEQLKAISGDQMEKIHHEFAEKMLELAELYDPWTYDDEDEEDENEFILESLRTGKTDSIEEWLGDVIDMGDDDTITLAKEILEDLREIESIQKHTTTKEENTMNSERKQYEMIKKVRKVITDKKIGLSSLVLASIHYYYAKWDKAETKINGNIWLYLDVLAEEEGLSMTQVVEGAAKGKYNGNDTMFWLDKTDGSINSCTESFFWAWVDMDLFIEYIIENIDRLYDFGVDLETIVAIESAVGYVEPEVHPVSENPVFTERELKLLSKGLEKLISDAHQMEALIPNVATENIETYIDELVELNTKLVLMILK